MTENERLISKEIERHFEVLLNRGFSVYSVKHYPEHMGNWIAILKSPENQIKITHDRGEISLSLGPNNGEKEQMWFGLRTVVFYLSQGENYIGFFEGELREKDKQFQRLAKIVTDYINEIISLMGRDFEKYKADLLVSRKQVLALDKHGVFKKLS